MQKLLLGSNNRKKREEIATLLAGQNIQIVIPSEIGKFEEPIEDGITFEENAKIKAIYYSKATGLITLADDSGLIVDALGDLPGVHSARFAGEDATDSDNCAKLLAGLKGVPSQAKTARFVCTVVVADKEKILGISEGACEGLIIDEMRGDNGFGYDPMFYYSPEKKTFAELDSEVKNKVSHRAGALAGILHVLQKLNN